MGKRRVLDDAISPSAAGSGVDIYGGPVIDPTKNVLDLVRAESKYQDAMRDAEAKLAALASKAEKCRIDDLAALRLIYDQRIAEDLRVNVKTTSDQLAGQLVKETGALSNQISALTTSFSGQLTTLTTSFTNQVSALTNAITPRIADLERVPDLRLLPERRDNTTQWRAMHARHCELFFALLAAGDHRRHEHDSRLRECKWQSRPWSRQRVRCCVS